MDVKYKKLLRSYYSDPRDEKLKEIYNAYKRIDPDLKIIATFYPQRSYSDRSGDFYDDIENSLWGHQYDVTTEILDMGLEDALAIQDFDYESDQLIPTEVIDNHFPHPYGVEVEESIRHFFEHLLNIQIIE